MLVTALSIALISCGKPTQRSKSIELIQWWYGEWVVVEELLTFGITALSEDDSRQLLGKTAHYSDEQARFEKNIVETPQYVVETYSADKFMFDFRVPIEDLGIKDSTIEVVEVNAADGAPLQPGGLLVFRGADEVVLAVHGSYFLMARPIN